MKRLQVYAVLVSLLLAYQLVRFVMLGDFTGVYWLSFILVPAALLFILIASGLGRQT